MSESAKLPAFLLFLIGGAFLLLLGSVFLAVEIHQRREYSRAAKAMEEALGELCWETDLSFRGSNELRLFKHPGMRGPDWTQMVWNETNPPLAGGGPIWMDVGMRPDQRPPTDPVGLRYGLSISLRRRRIVVLLSPRFELQWVNVKPRPEVNGVLDQLIRKRDLDYTVRD